MFLFTISAFIILSPVLIVKNMMVESNAWREQGIVIGCYTVGILIHNVSSIYYAVSMTRYYFGLASSGMHALEETIMGETFDKA